MKIYSPNLITKIQTREGPSQTPLYWSWRDVKKLLGSNHPIRGNQSLLIFWQSPAGAIPRDWLCTGMLGFFENLQLLLPCIYADQSLFSLCCVEGCKHLGVVANDAADVCTEVRIPKSGLRSEVNWYRQQMFAFCLHPVLSMEVADGKQHITLSASKIILTLLLSVW